MPTHEDHALYSPLADLLQAYAPPSEDGKPAGNTAAPHPLLTRLFQEAESRRAADIFISAGFPPAIKTDGKFTPLPLPKLDASDTAAIAEATMPAEQTAVFRQRKEADYTVQSHSHIRYRAHAYCEQGRIGMVLHRIRQDIPALDTLGLPIKLQELALASQGLLIVSGMAGSGKSTATAALLDYRNRNLPGHIITIEEPIEFIHQPHRCIITQREVGIDTPDWTTAVQHAARQSPDVICIGEVRNAAEMEHALRLAQTGHLCILNLHAANSIQAVEQITHFYLPEHRSRILADLALNLNGIACLRLAAKTNQNGRIASTDLLINTPAVQDLLFQGDLLHLRELMARSAQDGMQTADQNLFRLYADGIIDRQEALRQADSANDLRLQIQLHDEGNSTKRLYDRISDLNLMT
ncbi:PilT/PilU family type 4a pilus ATPase [Neisseria animalis]|uniref:PilT/PilU family type 4a pilus ATPase n=1 Tax=Neisseria animalis TaxID=492 RepID=A0A5P3MQM8_NEIAN|nr:PilT/PilU family type 4a pilus ATPase [Neisseria animalis]QEY23886.1 PilT/PilU family type 4a pilus ATPase [Neisseria animalis]ROW32046.1 PilT/PilU family type 4a pilus ATPase [Neisseria animalis]VEE05788.1 twitching motility - like protein [Neisseria animalis]